MLTGSGRRVRWSAASCRSSSRSWTASSLEPTSLSWAPRIAPTGVHQHLQSACAHRVLSWLDDCPIKHLPATMRAPMESKLKLRSCSISHCIVRQSADSACSFAALTQPLDGLGALTVRLISGCQMRLAAWRLCASTPRT